MTRKQYLTGPDDGSAEWAAEQAVMFIARAWFRRTHGEHGNGGKLVLEVTEHARGHITPDQWHEMGLTSPVCIH